MVIKMSKKQFLKDRKVKNSDLVLLVLRNAYIQDIPGKRYNRWTLAIFDQYLRTRKSDNHFSALDAAELYRPDKFGDYTIPSMRLSNGGTVIDGCADEIYVGHTNVIRALKSDPEMNFYGVWLEQFKPKSTANKRAHRISANAI